uniref:Cytochrome c-553 n=1 Tax=Gossypium raimondii TaxID=29730 RepID=A0A0D2R961_GOSRA|nr:hypothetical protein B456_010G168700 [Gossypium raimondii]
MFPPLVAAFVALSPICNTPAIAQSVDIQRGATLFGQACIGCHDGGGNIIQPGATLFTKDLERRYIPYHILWQGKNAWVWRELHAEGTMHIWTTFEGR